jgi:ribonuclease HI
VDDQWISEWISDDNLRQSLKDTVRLLSQSNENSEMIEVYTDGSLKRTFINNTMGTDESDSITVDMGAACFFPSIDRSISTSLNFWPSSTRAELVAILIALLAVPTHSRVKILTDSKAAIESINNFTTPRLSSRKISKTINNLLLFKIRCLISGKHLDMVMEKVKGHSGLEGNDIADRVAKNAIIMGNTSFTNSSITSLSSSYSYFPSFSGIPIEQKIRKFVMTIFQLITSRSGLSLPQ